MCVLGNDEGGLGLPRNNSRVCRGLRAAVTQAYGVIGSVLTPR